MTAAMMWSAEMPYLSNNWAAEPVSQNVSATAVVPRGEVHHADYASLRIAPCGARCGTGRETFEVCRQLSLQEAPGIRTGNLDRGIWKISHWQRL